MNDNKMNNEIVFFRSFYIEEYNTMLAEFMGLSIEGGVQADYMPHELKYHTSWDWLMPVVQKIERLSGELPTHIGNLPNDEDWLSDNFASANIDDTYQAVVEFIK